MFGEQKVKLTATHQLGEKVASDSHFVKNIDQNVRLLTDENLFSDIVRDIGCNVERMRANRLRETGGGFVKFSEDKTVTYKSSDYILKQTNDDSINHHYPDPLGHSESTYPVVERSVPSKGLQLNDINSSEKKKKNEKRHLSKNSEVEEKHLSEEGEECVEILREMLRETNNNIPDKLLKTLVYQEMVQNPKDENFNEEEEDEEDKELCSFCKPKGFPCCMKCLIGKGSKKITKHGNFHGFSP